MKNKIIIVLILTLIAPTCIFSQSEELERSNVGINVALMPHLIFVGTAKLEMDLQIARSNNWIVLSGLWSEHQDDFFWSFSFDEFKTWGVGLAYRYYAPFDWGPVNLYMQAGGIYNKSKVGLNGGGYSPYVYNGNEALKYVNSMHRDVIEQYGADLKAGIMIHSNRFIFFDFYIGVGYRSSNLEKVIASDANYNSAYLDPAYEGFTPLAGVRFGVSF